MCAYIYDAERAGMHAVFIHTFVFWHGRACRTTQFYEVHTNTPPAPLLALRRRREACRELRCLGQPTGERHKVTRDAR